MADWDDDAPQGNDLVSQFPQNERNARKAVKTNFGVDHHETDDADVGKHEQITLLEQSGDPSAASGQGRLFTKDVNGVIELFWIDSDGNVIQLTSGGSVSFEIVRMLEQSSDPSATSDQGKLYTKDVNGVTELFWIDSDGNVFQMTSGGGQHIVNLPEQGSDPAAETDRGKVYAKDVNGGTELFWRDADGNTTQITSSGELNIEAKLQDYIQFNNVFGQWEFKQSLNIGSGSEIFSLIYADGQFVAGDNQSTIWTSPDGETWTKQQDLSDQGVYALAYGDGLYVAGTFNGNVWTSPDAQTWADQQALDGAVFSLGYGDGLFVAGTGANSAWSSSDGQSWTNNQSLDGNVSAFAFRGGTFFAVTAGGSSWTSSDGQTWGNQTQIGTGSAVNDLEASPSLLVAVNENGDVAYSDDDAQTWNVTNLSADPLLAVTYGDGVYLVGTTADGVRYSLDPIGVNFFPDWAESTRSPSRIMESMAYADGVFVIGAENGGIFTPYRPPSSFTA